MVIFAQAYFSFLINIYNKHMNGYLAFTARILGLYAAILAFIHGLFEFQQGNVIVESISINAIDNGCIADQIWHACFPAMTIWPTYLTAGLITIIISSLFFHFVIFFLNKHYSPWIVVAFSIVNLLSGSGFIPTFTAILSAIALLIYNKQTNKSIRKQPVYAGIWIFLLTIYILYAAGGWLAGRYLNAFMINQSVFLFLSMDIFLPILCIIFAWKMDFR